MRTYIIAEVGPNHNGDIKNAREYVKRLSQIGVDAIKFQISIPENVYSLDSFKPQYQKDNEQSKTPIEMSKKHQLTYEEHYEVFQLCQELNIDYLCTAFDLESLIYLDQKFDLKYFKVASGEIFSLDMLEYIAQRNKPILLSTGMSTYYDIESVLDILNKNFKKDITIFHCVSSYPADAKDINLNAMQELKNRFGYNVGYSDHSLGNECAIASVALGAKVIEKHVTLDKNLPGPDHKASSTIDEFESLVKSVRKIEEALGQKEKIFTDKELEIKKAARKSIVAKEDIKQGEIITKDKICFKRPGFGLSPLEREFVIGKIASANIEKDRVIKKEFIKWQ